MADPTARFQAYLDLVRVQYGFPGMTAAYVLFDGTSGMAVLGIADTETGVAMTEHTHMLAKSIGKRFVGGLCIVLALEGRLTLDVNAPQISGKNSHDQASTLWLSQGTDPNGTCQSLYFKADIIQSHILGRPFCPEVQII